MKVLLKSINTKKIVCSVLSLLLFVSIFSTITLFIWVYKSSIVDRIDKKIVLIYVSRHQKQYDKAKKLVKNDNSKAIEVLEDWLSDLESIRMMDRLSSIKKEGLSLLTEILIEEGQLERALFWTEKWASFDEKDLHAKAQRARLICSIPGRETEGFKFLADIYNKVPEAKVIADTYAEILYDRGNYADAFIAFSKPFSAPGYKPEGSWHVFWDMGDGFSAKNMKGLRPEIDQDYRILIKFNLDDQIKRLRIDPPAYSRISIFQPKLFIEGGGRATSIDLWEVPLQFNQMSQRGARLKTFGGNDPYFYWQMPSKPAVDRLSISLELQLGLLFPEKMIQIAVSPEGEALEAELLSRNENIAVEFFKSIREDPDNYFEMATKTANERIINLLANAPMDIYWRNEEEAFSEERKSRSFLELIATSGKIEFDVLLSVKGTPSELRIDFPDVKDASYILNQVALIDGQHIQQVDVVSLSLVQQNNIDKQGNHFSVLGEDPHFSFKVYSLSPNSNVRVMGIVQ